jgi:hypothetical protein
MIKSGCDGRPDSLVDLTKSEEGSDAVGFRGSLYFEVQATIMRINKPSTLCILRFLMSLTKPFIRYAQNAMWANGLRYLRWGGNGEAIRLEKC